MSTTISLSAQVRNQVSWSLAIVTCCGAMLTQSRTRSLFEMASNIVDANIDRGGIISGKEIIGAILGAVVGDERPVKLYLCSEVGAHTLDFGDQHGVIMSVVIVYPSLIESAFFTHESRQRRISHVHSRPRCTTIYRSDLSMISTNLNIHRTRCNLQLLRSEPMSLRLTCRPDSHSPQGTKIISKTYNSGYSLVVTHLTTNPPVRCLNRAERTGSLVFNVLWSYVKDETDPSVNIPDDRS